METAGQDGPLPVGPQGHASGNGGEGRRGRSGRRRRAQAERLRAGARRPRSHAERLPADAQPQMAASGGGERGAGRSRPQRQEVVGTLLVLNILTYTSQAPGGRRSRRSSFAVPAAFDSSPAIRSAPVPSHIVPIQSPATPFDAAPIHSRDRICANTLHLPTPFHITRLTEGNTLLPRSAVALICPADHMRSRQQRHVL
ncbi:hypothetical protein U9M48_004982 [Paspalum notatum var. saurae]|uniref:Uncharacterized protein n=1 Tax=Paspalum notatum var. saurae TaxID=547442 RepID=A0AAQ3PP45_PASNO